MKPLVPPLDLTDPVLAAQVLALQRAAYRVEADMIGFEGIPPLHESLADLVAAPLTWLGIKSDGRVVAAIAFTQDGRGVDVDRLVVDPDAVRGGLGSALVGALDSEATITVSTGTKNLAAHRFYEAQGFKSIGESSPVPGLRVTHFERKAPNGA
jgi:GNAT superfamily N-acetyltransferase